MTNYVNGVVIVLMLFVESPQFAKSAVRIFTEDEVRALKCWLARNPLDGDIIQGSGGCRKMRWAAKGKGKRGGARVVYFHRVSAFEIRLMRVYVKNQQTDLNPSEIKQLKKETGEFRHE